MAQVLENIQDQARSNTYFRRVLENGKHTQIVLMSLNPGEDIGLETHPDNDQVLYCVQGVGKCVLDGEEHSYKKGDAVLVHAGTEHNFINGDKEEMKIITTYSPPHHPAGTIHETKAAAEAAEGSHH